jgi:hypothetical protein
MEPNRFDQLTKTLASSISRRQALKAITVSTVGGVIGWRATGTAEAAGNSACAQWCAAVFGADTAAARRCTADAAHRNSSALCYTCGPASPGGGVAPAAICCTHTRSGYCASYTHAACCTSHQVCRNGICASTCTSNGGHCSGSTDCCSGNCSNGICCNSGQVALDNGTCATPCTTAGDCSCGAQFCGSNLGSNVIGVCTENFNSTNACSTDTDCAVGYYCNGAGNCTPAC